MAKRKPRRIAKRRKKQTGGKHSAGSDWLGPVLFEITGAVLLVGFMLIPINHNGDKANLQSAKNMAYGASDVGIVVSGLLSDQLDRQFSDREN